MRLNGFSPIGAAVALVAAALARLRPRWPADEDRPTPSGLPVPRYVSLKFDEVNARSGPSDDHRLLWVYRVKGLPVQVVAEMGEWRRICDPDGGLSWVHERTTDGHRTVMRTQAGPAPIYRGPRPGAPVTAYLAPARWPPSTAARRTGARSTSVARPAGSRPPASGAPTTRPNAVESCKAARASVAPFIRPRSRCRLAGPA